MKTTITRSPFTLTDTGDANSRFAALTPRGRDVLNGILSGYSNKLIAYTLGISPRTVEIHRARMMRDLGARHVADAVRLALEAIGFPQNASDGSSADRCARAVGASSRRPPWGNSRRCPSRDKRKGQRHAPGNGEFP